MANQLPGTAPDAGTVSKFIASLVWRWKWLIAAAAFVVAALTFALYKPTTVEVWTGKTTLTLGVAPAVDYVLQGSGSALTPVEPPRSVVARISDPVFKNRVVTRADFAPATAASSRDMVAASLRAIAGESDRDVVVELTASSAADVQAAFRALAAEIGEIHGEMLKRRLKPVQDEIDKAKGRIAQIENSYERLNNRIFDGATDDKNRSLIMAPSVVASIPAWNELQDRIQRDTNLTGLSEPSVVHLEVNTYSVEHRSIGTLKASILAGLAMLLAAIVLTIVVGTPKRLSAD
jgi:hypothetical protein